MKYTVKISRLAFVLLLSSCRPFAVAAPAATVLPTIIPTPMFSADCIAGTYDEEIQSGNQARRYRIHIPQKYEPRIPIPLILGFHGNGGTAEQFESYSGFSILADSEGFIAVYPQGQGEPAGWNTGSGAGNEDLKFVRDLLDNLKSRCNIDPARIYAVGHSRGGGMANRLACNLADQIAAIGSASGAYQDGADCAPVRAVPIVAIHGFNDPVIPYNGFPTEQDGPPNAYFIIGTPIPQWASAWARRNDCNSKPLITHPTDLVNAQSWEECSDGANVILYTIKDWGHNWSGGPGAASGEFNSAQVIWDFLAQHPYK